MQGSACDVVPLGWDEGSRDPKGQKTGRDGRTGHVTAV